MKKWMAWVLCAVLVLGCIPFAQAAGNQTSGSAVDIVLLIDQSGSLWYEGNGNANDPNGYRLDAAQMVIAMLGLNDSRVAYVPFAARVFDNADREFQKIDGKVDYDSLMRKCEDLRKNPGGQNAENTSGGTDYAEALAYAYNLLAQRGPNETNQPMIILLTDGALEIGSRQSGYTDRIIKRYYSWNESTRLFQKGSENEHVLKADAEKLLDDAVYACAANHYPVYTVGIIGDKEDHLTILNDISQRTGAGAVKKVLGKESGQMKELPAYFGDMFAVRIGSSELESLPPRKVAGTENEYYVQFAIPNESVMEANLFVSKEGLTNQEMRNGAGVKMTSGDDSRYMELHSENFVLYKLRNPEPGIWELHFTIDPKVKNKDKVLEGISFNLLYNYDIVLRGSARNAEGVGSEFRRGDTLTFTYVFCDSYTGNVRVDQNLYSYQDRPDTPVDDKCVMNAVWELRQKTGATSFTKVDGGVLPAEGMSFAKTLDMKTIKETGHFNTLPEGEYVMYMKVEGSGLVREAEIPFTLVNTPPANEMAPIYLDRTVDGEEEETRRVEWKEHDIALPVDYDNDEILVSFEQRTGADVVELKYENGKMHSMPKRRGAVLADGEATGVLMVRETRTNGAVTEIPVTMNVTSGLNELNKRWDLRVTAGGQGGGFVAGKNSPVEIKLELLVKDENGRVDNGEEVKKVTARVDVVDPVSGRAHVDNQLMTLGDDGAFTYSLSTGSEQGSWNVSVRIFQGSQFIKAGTTDFSVANNPPRVWDVAMETQVQKKTITHNPLPDFLSFLGTASTESDRTLDMTNYFIEQDNEALTYELSLLPNDRLLTFTQTDSLLVLEAVEGANDTTLFKVKARDNDGEETKEVTFEVTLVDLVKVWTERGLFALAVLAGLILLILIIRQVHKPKFPRGAKVGVREGNSDYDTSDYEFMPGKKPISLAAIVMTDTAAKFGVSANALTNVMLVPVRSVNGSIGVRLNKRMDDVSVNLGTQAVVKSKKPLKWAPGDVLSLSGRTNTTGSELNILLYAPDVPDLPVVPAEDPFMGSMQDGFNTATDAFGANDVNGSWGGLSHTDSFGSSMQPADTGFTVPEAATSFPAASEDTFTPDSDSAPADDFGGF